MENANNILFRCSSLGKLMTEPRSKTETLSETCKKYLVEVFINYKYGRKNDIMNRYIAKGLMVEEDSLTLYSQYKNTIFFKNKERFSNEFITGLPDLTLDDSVVDIKSSWDIFTFFSNNNADKINKDYYWQLQGYMELCDKPKARLAYCLINTPDVLVQDQKKKLHWQMGLIDDSNDFLEGCEEIDRLAVYDDIPLEEKVIEIDVKRNPAEIEKLNVRVAECRDYMNNFLFKPTKTYVM
jgi:hypothetical protein